MTDMPPFLAVKDDDKNSGQGDESSETDDWDLPPCYDEPWHHQPIKGEERLELNWRVKEKYKTHCVALVLCLNVGVDPPDVVKTHPCARLECWIDPQSLSQNKALENIGQALQSQYERWQPRARYKQSLDPTSDEVKKLCCSLRRNAKDERVLFHYNGHGVPKPTAQGEIWVFNRAYTQYIPLSVYDLQTWMGAPSLYVYDCSNAGLIVDSFKKFADQHDAENAKAECASTGVSYKNCIQLGACAAGQSLPMNPELPADLFTACLTTPVKMAIKWFVLRNQAHPLNTHAPDLIDKIPGQVTDRRTMLGELNWIFTAITDTIAWNSLPQELFQQLFRADLLTASLCRNFLLADRIMRSYNCTPVSSPALPSLAGHPLWQAWEQTLDLALAQLPAMAANDAPYHHSPFFREQLTAFQVWLDLGKWSPARRPPDQLPMVLQVLLSTLHRVRALQILCRFLSLGRAAVAAVLAVGIFPYMLKLLQASAPDLRPTMVYIWAKIIAVDPSCQADLVNAKGHKYFLSVLADPSVDTEVRTQAAFVLASIVDNYPAGQEAALQGSMISICLEQLVEVQPALCVWAMVGLGRLWSRLDAARWAGARDLAHEKLQAVANHPDPQVRAACAFALGTWVGAGARRQRSDHANALDQQVGLWLAARLALDSSALVRMETLAALQWLVLIFEQQFIAVYLHERMRRSDREAARGGGRVDAGLDALAGDRDPERAKLPHPPLPTIGFGSVYVKPWAALCAMAREPHPAVSAMAAAVVAHVTHMCDNAGGGSPGGRGASSSLPPSPDAAHHYMQRVHQGHRRGKSGLSGTTSEDSVAPRDRADRESTSSSGSSIADRRPIVSTEFVEWAASRFASASGPHTDPRADVESRAHHARVWRRSRHACMRAEARALRSARVSRLDTQAFHSRCPLPPAVVIFHPYEQHAAIASKDNFGIWDWGTAAKLCVGSWKPAWGRITSLQYLSCHHEALLAAVSHAGHLLVYRPSGSSTEPSLVAAWRALEPRPPPPYRPPPAQPLYSLAQLVSDQFLSAEEKASSARKSEANGAASGGSPPVAAPATLLRWCARQRSFAVGGLAPVVRLWDCTSELLLHDINTGTDSAVTSLWRGDGGGGSGAGHGLLAAGFGSGAVRVWDERDPHTPVLALHEHTAPVLCAALRHDLNVLLTVCMGGEVRVYDARRGRCGAPLRLPAPLAAADVHPLAELLACGSVNQCLSVLDFRGATLSTIRFHEGFMGARIGPVSTLAFHPLRCALGVGAKDSTVSVYVGERR